MKRASAILLAVLLGVVGVGPAVMADAEAPHLDADMALMMSWFTGRFDNHLQALEDEEAGIEHPHERIHSIFARVELPSFGENVFYVEQYGDGDPEKIYRQRIYSFTKDEAEQAIRLTIHKLPDAKSVIGAYARPQLLTGLTPETAPSPPGCEVYWRLEDHDHFVGTMKPDSCRITSRRNGKLITITDTLRLDADEIWIMDQAFDEDGKLIWGNADNVPHKLKRVRPFRCWAAVPRNREAVYRDGAEAEEWQGLWSLETHDQGGRIPLRFGDADASFAIELEQRVFSGRKHVPVLKLGVRDLEKDKVVRYTWSDPDSRLIGLNLRWLQVGCTLE